MTKLNNTSEARQLEGEGIGLITKIKNDFDFLRDTLNEASELMTEGTICGSIDDAKKQIKQIRLHCPRLEKNLDRYDTIAFELEQLKGNMIEGEYND